MARNAIGLAQATEDYGTSFFANGAAPGGVLEHPGTIKDPARVREFRQATFGGARNSNKIAVLEEGMKYTPIAVSPEQAQFLRGLSALDYQCCGRVDLMAVLGHEHRLAG